MLMDNDSVMGEEFRVRVQESISSFLRQESLYEMLPTSGQVLVLEKNLSLFDVIEIFLSHDQECALVWDPDALQFTGVVSDRDLLNIMISLYNEADMQIEESRMLTSLRSTTLAEWRKMSGIEGLVSVSGDDDLLNATRILKRNHLHRVPIIDTRRNQALGILSMEEVLRFFVDNYVGDETLFQIPLESLNIGTTSIVTAPASISLIEALKIMAKHMLSSLPLLGEDLTLHSILFLTDIPRIMRSNLYLTPGTSIVNALRLINTDGELGTQRIGIIQPGDTIANTVEKLAMSSERKLYKLEENQVSKIITESDIFQFFIS